MMNKNNNITTKKDTTMPNKNVIATITNAVYGKMKNKDYYSVKLTFHIENDIDDTEPLEKIYNLTTKGAAMHLRDELANMKISLNNPKELPDIMKRCIGKKVELLLVELPDGNYNKFITGLAEANNYKNQNIWSFLDPPEDVEIDFGAEFEE